MRGYLVQAPPLPANLGTLQEGGHVPSSAYPHTAPPPATSLLAMPLISPTYTHTS